MRRDRARPTRAVARRWLEDAHAVAATLAAAAEATLSPGDARRRRLRANARRAAVLFVEDIGGLKTATDEAECAPRVGLISFDLA